MATTDRSRSWILTLPAEYYTKEYTEEALNKYTYVGQLEKGAESGYLHWQIYIENETQIAFKTLAKKFPKGHFETRLGSRQQAYDYVTKQDTAQGVKIENGEIDLDSTQGQRNDLQRLSFEILYGNRSASDLILTEPSALNHYKKLEKLQLERDNARWTNTWRDIDVHYLSGPSRVGKTRRIYAKYGGSMFRVTDYRHPFDSYRGQAVLVLDEFRSQIDFSLVLDLLDGHPLELPCRFGNRWAAYTTVWVVSNRKLEQQYIDLHDYHPEDWDPFIKRFHSVQRMEKDGTLEDVSRAYALNEHKEGELQ